MKADFSVAGIEANVVNFAILKSKEPFNRNEKAPDFGFPNLRNLR
jgi:hypothetical protein